jgi:uncharacterized protein YkwD
MRLTSIRSRMRAAMPVVCLAGRVALSQFLPEDAAPISAAAAQDGKSQQSTDLDRAAQLIVVKTNELGEAHGLRPFVVNRTLTETSRYFAEHMARTNEFSHTADGKAPADRAWEHGYDYCLVSDGRRDSSPPAVSTFGR